MLHTRDMLPAIPEVIPERVWEVTETHEPVYERQDGLLIATDKVATVKHGRYVLTGKAVDTGSKLQQDRHCGDCGADLVPANADIYYLLCGRLNVKDPEGRRPEDGRWLPVRRGDEVWWELVVSEQPYPDCVLECGGWNL